MYDSTIGAGATDIRQPASVTCLRLFEIADLATPIAGDLPKLLRRKGARENGAAAVEQNAQGAVDLVCEAEGGLLVSE